MSRSPNAPRAARVVALAALFGAGCGTARGDGSSATVRARHLMGSALRIETQPAVPEETFDAAFDAVARLEAVLSNWRSDSEVARLNERAARAPFVCSPELFAALDAALRVAAETDGAFDPTVEPLVRRLRLRHPADALPLTLEELTAPAGPPAAPADPGPVGWRGVRLDAGSRTVRFAAAGMGVDFGGIGKGIGLDAAAAELRRRGVRRASLDFGGQILAVGAPAGTEGWTISLADPADRGAAVGAVRLRDLSVSTSGNHARGPGPEGGVIPHLIDPARSVPSRFEGTVTVVAADATRADALSTALFVMGPRRGARWAEDRGVAALFLWRARDGALRRRATTTLESLAPRVDGTARALNRPSDRSAAP